MPKIHVQHNREKPSHGIAFKICKHPSQEYLIKKTWNGDDIKSHDPVKLTLSASEDGKYLVVQVDAPFFNDPGIPNAPAGKPCPQLWDYEGLHISFLGNG